MNHETLETMDVFNWNQPFQPKPVLVDLVEVSQWNTFSDFSNCSWFQPFESDSELVEKVDQPNQPKTVFSH